MGGLCGGRWVGGSVGVQRIGRRRGRVAVGVVVSSHASWCVVRLAV